MKELFLILLIYLSPLIGQSQEFVRSDKGFSIGVNFSPNYSYRILKKSDEFQNIIAEIEKVEHPSIGFNGGISCQYSLFKNLEIELGIQFSRQASIYKDLPILTLNENDPSGLADSQIRIHYIEVPFRINYFLFKNRIFGYLTYGFSFNKFLNANSKTWLTYDNGVNEVISSTSEIQNFNNTIFGIIGGFGIGYRLIDILEIRIEPLFRYSITSIISDSQLKRNNYSYGLQLGVNFKL